MVYRISLRKAIKISRSPAMRRRYQNDKDGYGTEMMMQPDPYCLQHDLTVPSPGPIRTLRGPRKQLAPTKKTAVIQRIPQDLDRSTRLRDGRYLRHSRKTTHRRTHTFGAPISRITYARRRRGPRTRWSTILQDYHCRRQLKIPHLEPPADPRR